MGQNGSGKSTILKLIAGGLHPHSGVTTTTTTTIIITTTTTTIITTTTEHQS